MSGIVCSAVQNTIEMRMQQKNLLVVGHTVSACAATDRHPLRTQVGATKQEILGAISKRLRRDS